MKKNILILIIMMLLFTGCNKDEMSKVNNDDKAKVQDNVIDDNKVQSITDNEEEVLDDNSNEIIVEPMEEITTTTTRSTTKKTTKKTTTSKVTTTVKSEKTTKKVLEETETTTTKKAEEDNLKFYFPIDKGTYFRMRSNLNVNVYNNKVAFYAGIDTPVYSIAKGKIYSVVHYVSSCYSPNPYIDFGNIMIVHEDSEGTLYSSYRCVKNPVFSEADKGKEVTENTVIGYVGKLVVPQSEKQITSFVFSIRNKPGYNSAYDLDPRKYLTFPSGDQGYINHRY